MRKVLFMIVVGFCAFTGAAAIYVGEYGTAVFILGTILAALFLSRYV